MKGIHEVKRHIAIGKKGVLAQQIIHYFTIFCRISGIHRQMHREAGIGYFAILQFF